MSATGFGPAIRSLSIAREEIVHASGYYLGKEVINSDSEGSDCGSDFSSSEDEDERSSIKDVKHPDGDTDISLDGNDSDSSNEYDSKMSIRRLLSTHNQFSDYGEFLFLDVRFVLLIFLLIPR